jgi:hypothetical protein
MVKLKFYIKIMSGIRKEAIQQNLLIFEGTLRNKYDPTKYSDRSWDIKRMN